MLQQVIPHLHNHTLFHAEDITAIMLYTEEDLAMQDYHKPYTHLRGL